MRHSLHVSPPSVDVLCASRFDFSSLASGGLILVCAMSFFPPSTGTMVQNGMMHLRPLLFIGDHVLPSSSDIACCWKPSGPRAAKTKRRYTPFGSARR